MGWKGHGAATQASHLFIDKMADGTELAQKSGQLAPPSEARWRWHGPRASVVVAMAWCRPALASPPSVSTGLLAGAHQNCLNLWERSKWLSIVQPGLALWVPGHPPPSTASGEREGKSSSAGMPRPHHEEKQAQGGHPATILPPPKCK